MTENVGDGEERKRKMEVKKGRSQVKGRSHREVGRTYAC
jgi:hypothetical protein